MPYVEKIQAAQKLAELAKNLKSELFVKQKPHSVTQIEFLKMLETRCDFRESFDDLEKTFKNEDMRRPSVLITLRSVSEAAILYLEKTDFQSFNNLTYIMDELIEEANQYLMTVQSLELKETEAKRHNCPARFYPSTLKRTADDSTVYAAAKDEGKRELDFLRPQTASHYDRKLLESIGAMLLKVRVHFYYSEIENMDKDMLYLIGAHFINDLAGQEIELPEFIALYLAKQAHLAELIPFERSISKFSVHYSEPSPNTLKKSEALYSSIAGTLTREKLQKCLRPEFLGNFRNTGYIRDCRIIAAALVKLRLDTYSDEFELNRALLSIAEMNAYAHKVYSAMTEYTVKNAKHLASLPENKASLIEKHIKELVNIAGVGKDSKLKQFKVFFENQADYRLSELPHDTLDGLKDKFKKLDESCFLENKQNCIEAIDQQLKLFLTPSYRRQ